MTIVLVPLDRSPAAASAIPVAERVARTLGAEVVLLAVGELPETPAQKEEERALNERLFEQARPHFEGLTVRERVEASDSPVDAILEAVDEEAVDVVVMASDGRVGRSSVAQPQVAEALELAGVRVEIVDQTSEEEA